MRHPRRARAHSAAISTLAALAAVALLAAGCGGAADPRDPTVSLLPAAGALARSWNWTARCTLTPAASAGDGCATAGPILGFAQLNGDEWNLGGSATGGSLAMSEAAGGAVRISGRFASTPPCTESECLAPSASTWVRGYPNVLYGINQCYADTSPAPSPRLALPTRLDRIPRQLTGVTVYSTRTARVTYDVTYDLWLHPTGTSRPCRSQGTLEILVWTAYDARALLPASLRIGTARIPAALDGVARPRSRAWSVYASNVYRDGRTAPWGGTLWFVPARADVVERGRVSVDLGAALTAAGRLLRDDYGWPPLKGRYWLDTASFGIEFGPARGEVAGAGPSRFNALISAYCLDVRTGPADAACG